MRRQFQTDVGRTGKWKSWCTKKIWQILLRRKQTLGRPAIQMALIVIGPDQHALCAVRGGRIGRIVCRIILVVVRWIRNRIIVKSAKLLGQAFILLPLIKSIKVRQKSFKEPDLRYVRLVVISVWLEKIQGNKPINKRRKTLRLKGIVLRKKMIKIGLKAIVAKKTAGTLNI